LIAIDNTFAALDAFERGKAYAALDALRSAGTTVLLVSHEAELLRRLCDEVWWLDGGRLVRQGDPGEVLDAYSEHVARRLRAWGETTGAPLRTATRRGDGRAEIVSLETVGADGRPTMIWKSGEPAKIRAVIAYREGVQNPVIGIMIRTRIGLEVYGTNTELERIDTGTVVAGDRLEVCFQFRCDLCPGEYTLTAASHDADGTAHDWIDDAVAFVVADSRYTAGVANLKATASVARI
jgi:lipopolysaccharide transport system ATP-binding protein